MHTYPLVMTHGIPLELAATLVSSVVARQGPWTWRHGDAGFDFDVHTGCRPADLAENWKSAESQHYRDVTAMFDAAGAVAEQRMATALRDPEGP